MPAFPVPGEMVGNIRQQWSVRIRCKHTHKLSGCSMSHYGIALLLIPLYVASCARVKPAPSQLSSWPDNPCAVLEREQVTSATRATVTRVRRAPGIGKIVAASASGRDPGPGEHICVYETREFGDITIVAPTADQRSSAAYWRARETYFRAYPGSARSVSNVGEDAWLAAGTVLHVLVRRDLHFSVAMRDHHERAQELLVALAGAVVARF